MNATGTRRTAPLLAAIMATSAVAAAARTAYLAQENRTRSDPGPAGRPPLRLASVSITVPCHRGAATTFVAYGDTDVFTLGQSMQPVALVFRRADGAWKLAAIVNQSSGGGHPAWPALCRAGAGTTAPAVLARHHSR